MFRVGVIGAGRLGAAVGAALAGAGHEVVGVVAGSAASQERAAALLPGAPLLTADQVVERANLVLVTTPDDAIAPLVAGLERLGAWHQGHVAVHFSGAHGLDVLAPARRAGAVVLALHPVMTFTGTSIDLNRLHQAPIAVTAQDGFEMLGDALAVELGGEPFHLEDAHRVLYHAALSHGANHLVTLVAQAQRLLGEAGVDRAVLAPLLTAALEGALTSGDEALTGPVARADAGTVTAHLQALAAQPDQQITQTYRHLAAATARRAAERRRLGPGQLAELLAILEEK